MYEVREASRVVLVTQEVGEVLRHMEAEGFHYVTEVLGTRLFHHNTEDRTAAVHVRAR